MSFLSLLNRLRKIVSVYGNDPNLKRAALLHEISKCKLPRNKYLLKYTDLLLFICSHPGDKKQLSQAEKELARIVKFMQEKRNIYNEIFQDSGLPFTETLGGFSHDLIRNMISSEDCKIELGYFASPGMKLNEILRTTLPSTERPLTWLGKNNDELMDALDVKKNDRLSFIINELSKYDSMPFAKDQLYDSLEINVSIKPKSRFFSKPYNRVTCKKIFYHENLLKNFDHESLLNTPVPQAVMMDDKEKTTLISVIRNSLTLMLRETDPSTYLDRQSLRLYELERGISVAIYGMMPQRQHAFESYVGYTLFKNGFPAAYGGGWILGKRSTFGINIFEPYRGGESGYIMCQLLRLYRQVFGITYFEVEPYQYGKDNPDGIKSGAFWFYYKYGFRPLDKQLSLLAEREKKKFVSVKNYRSGTKILLKFTRSNVAKNSGTDIPPTVRSFNEKITELIAKKYKGDRRMAIEVCKDHLIQTIAVSPADISKNQQQALEEFALLNEATGNKYSVQKDVLKNLISTKTEDVYQYQQFLLRLLN